ncbi:hypothetical protein [Emcibacter sp.]|uniref:hypothetical protein n=1 Tax=Emcibacter sp. TaxID=1979954 RepID=UPI003A9386C7
MLEKLIQKLLYDVDEAGEAKPEERTFGLRSRPTPSTEQKLIKLLSESPMVNTGRIQLLGLQELKEKLGDHWPGVRESVLIGLEQIVRKRISDEDVFFSRSEEEHLVVFAHLGEDEARLVCAKILQELSIKFLGQVETREIVVRTAVGQFDGNLTFQEDTLHSVLSSASVQNKDIASGNGQDNDGSSSRNAGNILSFLSGEKERIRKKFKATYIPVWDRKHEVLSTYAVDCHMRGEVATGDYSSLIGRLKSRDKVCLDHMLAEEAGSKLLEFYGKKYRAVFSLPVSYETVFNSHLLAAYVQKLMHIPKELSRYTSITLKEFPAGTPSAKIFYISSLLRQYSPTVMLEFSGNPPPHPESYGECGLQGVILQLNSEKTQDENYWTSLSTAVSQFHKIHLRTMLTKVSAPEEMLLANECGFDFLSGDAVKRSTTKPAHMLRISCQELLTK